MNIKSITNKLNLFKNSKPTLKHEFHTKFAFECGGVKYFEFVDKNNLPYQRGLDALTFFQELQNGITKEYLLDHVKIMSGLLSQAKIDIGKVAVHNNRLSERLNYLVSKDIIYKIASIAFIDENENPLSYDTKYNESKIQNWKDNGADAFFLSQPMRRLIPFLKEYGETSPTYLMVVEEVEKLQQAAHSLLMLELELKAEKD
jgi:hypothetical protein